MNDYGANYSTLIDEKASEQAKAAMKKIGIIKKNVF